MRHIKDKNVCFSGVVPNTDLLAGSGVDVDARGAVVVDKVTLSLASTLRQTQRRREHVLACDKHTLLRL